MHLRGATPARGLVVTFLCSGEKDKTGKANEEYALPRWDLQENPDLVVITHETSVIFQSFVRPAETFCYCIILRYNTFYEARKPPRFRQALQKEGV